MSKDTDVIAWVRLRRAEGLTSKQIVAASRAYELGYPGEHPLSDGVMVTIDAILRILAGRPAQAPRRGPTQGGRRKRQIHIEKSGGQELRELRVKIMDAVAALEHYQLPGDIGLSEEEQYDIAALYDDLTILARWTDQALSATAANMSDLERQRKRSKLAALANDLGAEPAERAAAERALNRLDANAAQLSA